MKFEDREIDKVLIVRLKALGDIVLSTPLLRALNTTDPAIEIDVVVEESFRPALEGLETVHRVWAYPPKRRGLGSVTYLWQVRRLYRRLRRRRYDLVIDLMGSTRTAILTTWTGAPVRFGYRLGARGRLHAYTHRFGRGPAHELGLPYAAYSPHDMARRLGLSPLVPTLDFPQDAELRGRAETWLRTNLEAGRPRIGILPARGYPAKSWSVDSHRALVEILRERLATPPVVLWGPGEKEIAGQVAEAGGVLAPETSIPELYGMLQGIDLLIGIDSGPKHMAVAAGTPTLTLFGPTDPDAWTPPDGPHRVLRIELDCSPCHRQVCPFHDHPCMTRLTPARVAEAALAIVAESGGLGKASRTRAAGGGARSRA